MNLLFGLLISLMLIYIGALIFEKRNIGLFYHTQLVYLPFQ